MSLILSLDNYFNDNTCLITQINHVNYPLLCINVCYRKKLRLYKVMSAVIIKYYYGFIIVAILHVGNFTHIVGS